MQYFVYSSTWISQFSRSSSCGFCRASCKRMLTSLHIVIPHTWPTSARKFMDATGFQSLHCRSLINWRRFLEMCAVILSYLNVWIFFEKPANTVVTFLSIRHFTYNWRHNVSVHTISYFDGWINVESLTASNSKCMGLVHFIKNRVY